MVLQDFLRSYRESYRILYRVLKLFAGSCGRILPGSYQDSIRILAGFSTRVEHVAQKLYMWGRGGGKSIYFQKVICLSLTKLKIGSMDGTMSFHLKCVLLPHLGLEGSNLFHGVSNTIKFETLSTFYHFQFQN